MGLVNELQESAERDDVLTVLRKAKRLSSKLGLKDISEWLDHEQNGYPDEAEVPIYRHIKGQYHYKTNGYIPVGYGLLKNGIEAIERTATVHVRASITEITSWIENIDKGNGHMGLPIRGQEAEEIRGRFQTSDPDILQQLTFFVRLNDVQIKAVPEHIKNKVLDWACKLEEAGVTGDDQSFTDKEKRIAETINFHIVNSTVDQINNAGVNLKGEQRR
jgi:hypothetical protein